MGEGRETGRGRKRKRRVGRTEGGEKEGKDRREGGEREGDGGRERRGGEKYVEASSSNIITRSPQ